MKKKGSSLITIVIFMMFLMIVGGSIITVTAMDFKSRVNESKRIENLYGAESGLEIAYDILLKASDYAVNKALVYASEQKIDNSEINLNDMFQQKYVEVLLSQTFDHQLDVSIPSTEWAGLVYYLVENFTYPVVDENNKLTFEASKFNPHEKEIAITVEVLNQKHQTVTDLNQIKDTFVLNIIATYQSENLNNHVGENQRIIARMFEVKIPNYNQSLVSLYPVFKDKVLTVDGNVNFETNHESNEQSNYPTIYLDGDVWIGGNSCVNSNNQSCSFTITDQVSYEKYQNGFILKNVNLMLDGTLASIETVSLRNQVEFIMNGNLYARNVYLGKENVGSISKNVNLYQYSNSQTRYDMVLVNDLSVNVTEDSTSNIYSDVIIDRFYGVSDKNILAQETALTQGKLHELASESSSIIINSEGASLEILDEAYIGGVAYLDVKDENNKKYQTGESVAVKPNYLAYSMIVDGFADAVNLRYYNPLMLIESIKNQGWNAIDKANYFVQVNEDGVLELKSGGVKLPDTIYSAGATISVAEDGIHVLDSNMISPDVAIVANDLKLQKTNDHENNVAYMGMPVLDNEALTQRRVSNQINWNSSSFDEVSQIIKSDEGTVVLNSYGSQKIVLSQTEDSYGVKIGSSNVVEVSGPLLVITKGDIEFSGNIDVTGSFIVGGHVSVDEEMSELTLAYNEEKIKTLLAAHQEVLKDVFVDSGKVMVPVDSNNEQDYSATSIISKGRWTLVK
ncbi:MAG TPA: hypothetical protein DCY20_05300 [Firmicutes bacterium]|nr:hypothetical protein [Bacillota bacterium]